MAMNSGNKVGAEINVTPLIDVLLVLLIIFMVLVPIAPKGLAAAVPQDGKSEQAGASRVIVVEVEADGRGDATYRINAAAVSRDGLESALRTVLDSRQDRTMFVRGDKDLAYSQMAEVIDVAHRAGADRVGLITAGALRKR